MEILIALGSIAGMLGAVIGWIRAAQQKHDLRLAYEAELIAQERKHEHVIKTKQAEIQQLYETERAERIKEFEVLARTGDLDAVREWFDRMQQAGSQSGQPSRTTSTRPVPPVTSN